MHAKEDIMIQAPIQQNALQGIKEISAQNVKLLAKISTKKLETSSVINALTPF